MTRVKPRSVKVPDDTYRRAKRIAAREKRTIQAVIDRAVQHYDQEARRAQARRVNEEEL